MKPNQEWKEPKEYPPNPLAKYVDELDRQYVQPRLTPRIAQYILKALDYLFIHSKTTNQPALIEQELHEEAEAIVTDVIIYAPEEDDGKTKN
jgi:hypothetical protein